MAQPAPGIVFANFISAIDGWFSDLNDCAGLRASRFVGSAPRTTIFNGAGNWSAVRTLHESHAVNWSLSEQHASGPSGHGYQGRPGKSAKPWKRVCKTSQRVVLPGTAD